jgi:hypothetical protein
VQDGRDKLHAVVDVVFREAVTVRQMLVSKPR